MFGERIAEQRKKLGLSQEELAEKLNISQKSISKYELGDRKPQYKVLVRMAEYFGVTTDYLLGLGDIMETNEKSNEIAQRMGWNIKKLREQKGLTQQELAVRVDVAQATVANWESGRREPDINILIRIAKLFNVTLDELVMKELTPPIPMYARNLEYLRKKRGMSQQEIAELVGLKNKSSISLIEAGKYELSVANLEKLADFFGVTMDQIIKQDLSQEVSEWKQ